MRFATFSADGLARAAAVSDAGLHPLPDGTSVVQLVRAGLPHALEAGRAALHGAAVPVAEVLLLPPLDPPGSGTCGNGGCLAELWGRRGQLDPPPLRPGDVVEMTVEGIGTIRNTVIPGPDLPPVRLARPRPRTRKRTL